MTNGRLCGRIGVPGQPLRLPRMIASTRRRGACVDVNRCATGEVDRGELVGDPAAGLRGAAVEREHPVCDREVDERHPQAREQQPAAELDAVGHRAGDQRDGDDREHQLEGDEHRRGQREHQRDVDRGGRFDTGTRIGDDFGSRVSADEALEAEELRRVAEQIADVVAESKRVAVQHPQHRHHTHGADAHHDHVEHALGANHAAVEERQARGHQQHHRGACQHPCCVTGVRLTQYRELVHSQFPPSTRQGRKGFTTVDLVQDNAEWLFRLRRLDVSLV